MTRHDKTPDRRYTVGREWCGYRERQYVARFCGERLASSAVKAEAIAACYANLESRTGSRILHNGRNYTASVVRGLLIIASNRKRGGQSMKPDHPQFNEWLQALSDEEDSDIRESLCRAFLNT